MKGYNNRTTTYYRYRKDNDGRLQLLKSTWISGKHVLDIGCNTGDITFAVAKKFNPRVIEGIDVDGHLIGDAKKKHRILSRSHDDEKGESATKSKSLTAFVPRVLAKKCVNTKKENNLPFPRNVLFKEADILSENILSVLSRSDYDTILCLSVTKWVQLNFGDNGLLKLFNTAFKLLKPGGLFVLEYQPWKSYIKNRNTSSHTKAIFPTITIRPEQFESHLAAVGFEVIEQLGTALSEARGFNRPFLVLTKPRDVAKSRIGTVDTVHRNVGDECDQNNIAYKKQRVKSKKKQKEKKKKRDRDSNEKSKSSESACTESIDEDQRVKRKRGKTDGSS